MTLPNFLILGAQKAGTTSLYFYLAQHPEIYMSPVKEPHFFTFGDGNTNYKDPDFDPNRLVIDFQAYQSLFDGVTNEKAIGEASPSYLYNPRAVQQIKTYIPSAKFIAVLRNPIERAFSNYMHCRRDGRETFSTFESALAQETQRINSGWSDLWHYQQQGFYFEQLSRYFANFNPNQIKIFLYDDFQKKPHEMVKQILEFLDVDPTWTPDISAKHNVSGVPRNSLALNIIKGAKPFNRAFKRIVPSTTRKALRELILVRPTISTSVRESLEELYFEDVLKVQALIDRDLSHWFQIVN